LGGFYVHGGLFSNSYNGSKAMQVGLQKRLRNLLPNAFSLLFSRNPVAKHPWLQEKLQTSAMFLKIFPKEPKAGVIHQK